MGTKMAAKWTI